LITYLCLYYRTISQLGINNNKKWQWWKRWSLWWWLSTELEQTLQDTAVERVSTDNKTPVLYACYVSLRYTLGLLLLLLLLSSKWEHHKLINTHSKWYPILHSVPSLPWTKHKLPIILSCIHSVHTQQPPTTIICMTEPQSDFIKCTQQWQHRQILEGLQPHTCD